MFRLKKKIKNKTLQTTKGFSLIEMLMVVAIIALISSSVLINFTVFNGGVTLENLAYEISLIVRQAQFFSINVLQAGTPGNITFDAAYGVSFSNSSENDQNKQFILFADINNDGIYEPDEDELVEVYHITKGNIIKYLCVYGTCPASESKANLAIDNGIDKLEITFKRPDPSAMFTTNNVNQCGVENKSCGYAKIFVGSTNPKVNDKVITVGITGQISVGNPNVVVQ